MSTSTPQLPAPRAKFHWFLPAAGDGRANLILAYHSLDFDEFILSGYTHPEKGVLVRRGRAADLETQTSRLTARSRTS